MQRLPRHGLHRLGGGRGDHRHELRAQRFQVDMGERAGPFDPHHGHRKPVAGRGGERFPTQQDILGSDDRVGGTLTIRNDIKHQATDGEPRLERRACGRTGSTGHRAGEHRARPDEPRHERGVGEAEYLLGRAGLGNRAVGQHRHEVAKPEGVIKVVGHLERRGALPLVQRAQLTPKGVAHRGIHRGERFIEQEDARPRGQGPGQRHPLLLAAAESPHAALQKRHDAEHFGQRFDPRGALRLRHPLVPESVADVLSHRKMGEEVVVLVDESHPPPFRGPGGHVLPMQPDGAPRERRVARDGLEEGRLAGAGRADDQRVSAGRHLEGHIPELKAPGPHGQPVESDHWSSAPWSNRTRRKTPTATSNRTTAAGMAAPRP